MIRWLIWAVTGVILAASLALALLLWSMREQALEDARLGNLNLATVLAGEMVRSVQGIDLILHEAADAVGAHSAGLHEGKTGHLPGQDVGLLLRHFASRLTQADGIDFFAADGRLIAGAIGAGASLPDEAVTELAGQIRCQGACAVAISWPVQVPHGGEWMVLVARPVFAMPSLGGTSAEREAPAPAEPLLGFIAARVPLRVFDATFRTIRLPHAESFMLVRADGRVLVRHPHGTGRLDAALPPSAPWFRLISQGGGSYRAPGYFDGIPRWVSMRPVPGTGLVVNVGVSEAAALAQFRSLAWTISCAGAVVVIGLLALVWGLRRQFRQVMAAHQVLVQRNDELHRATEALAGSEHERARSGEELHTTLAFMDQGIMMVDEDGYVAICNDNAIRLLGLPVELMRNRPELEVVLASWRRAQAPAVPDPGLLKALGAAFLSTGPQVHEGAGPAGSVIEARSVPLESGGVVTTFTDITERKQAEDAVRHEASHDSLTGLENRASFNRRLLDTLARARRAKGQMAVMYLDLDHFKQVNDSHGHATGDALLIAASQRMSVGLRGSDTLARLGGDEFAVVLDSVKSLVDAQMIAERLLDSVSLIYEIDDIHCEIGVSIGVALYPQDADDADGLLRRADEALYDVKRSGRNMVRMATELRGAKLLGLTGIAGSAASSG